MSVPLDEAANSVLEINREFFEKIEKAYVELKHVLRKVERDIVVIPADQKEALTRRLKDVKYSCNELAHFFHKVTKEADVGCDKVQGQFCDSVVPCLDSLKPVNYSDDVQRRSKHTRVSADSAIGSIGSSISSRSDFDNTHASMASENEDTMPDYTGINDLSKDQSTEHVNEANFQDLNILSLQSCSLNVEQDIREAVQDSGACDPVLGKVVDQPPERDSVAFEKGIDNNDKTLMDAQGRVAQGQQRHIRSNYDGVPSTIVIKEDYFNNDGSDV